MHTLLVSTIFILILGAPSNHQAARDPERTPFKCSQPALEQAPLILEAEKNKYTVGRVVFIGHTYTRDFVLRRRITILLQEGDLFTRSRLVKSLQNLNQLKTIYPVRQNQVVIQLDKGNKIINLTICVREKRRSAPRERV